MEQRIAYGRRRRARPLLSLLAAAVLLAAPFGGGPSSDPLSAAAVERRLAVRYPHLRHAENAVIACPDRGVEPGGAARCWVLARVGLQRSVIVRLSQRGNELEVED